MMNNSPESTISTTESSSYSNHQPTDDLGYLPWFVATPTPDIYRYGTYAVLDFETTNHDFGNPNNPSNKLVTGWWYRSDLDIWKNVNEHGIQNLFDDLRAVDFVIAHNIKFEIGWLRRLGFHDDTLYYDTYLAEYCIAGNRRWPLDLDSVAEKYTGKKKHGEVHDALNSGVCPSTISIETLDAYCRNDVEITHELFTRQLYIADGSGLLPSIYTRCLLTPILVDLERRGMALDRQAVRETFQRYNSELGVLRKTLADLTGGVNLNSPKQLASYLYDTLKFGELTKPSGEADRTDAGGRRTDADTVARLRVTTESQKRFVELFGDYGSLKVNTKALEKMWQCCLDTPSDQVPILYASYNQAVTQTHRLSSSGARYKLQFHNFNRNFKPLFTARRSGDGWLVGEGDGAQLEFRVAAHLGRDPVAAADIRDARFDAHYQTAQILLGKQRSDVTKAERQDAKPFTFKPLYGGQSGTRSQKAYYKFFQNKYRGIYGAQTGWTHRVVNSPEKCLVTETGLRFYWPDTKVQGDGYITNRTSIFNYPVQSLATADIIPIGLVCAYYRMVSMGCNSFIVNTIHDSIIAEVAPDEEDIFRRVVETALTRDTFVYLWRCYGIRFTCPLGCESKVGTHWGKGKERKFDLDPANEELSKVLFV